MLGYIVKVLDTTTEKTNDLVGIQIAIPKPSKLAFKISAVTNGTVGTGLIAFGVLSSKKWAIVLGGLGILGAIYTATID
ncbi:hypothetical protein [Metaclostridioides mangenotii]|uniref:hypothetical protein n=1 Tax=Metaclostridioides mangenotii TaxID=1540 RepID=UPI0026EC17F2|nr:hypothetical protein [Clostridioides mangenotii]